MRYLLHAYEYIVICAVWAALAFLGIGVLIVRPEKWPQAVGCLLLFGAGLATWVLRFPGLKVYHRARRDDLLGIWYGRLLAFPYVLPPFAVVWVLKWGWPNFHFH